MRAIHAVLALALALAGAGCIENMGDLKEALGATPAPPPEPEYLPPLARAQANATSVLVGAPVSFLSDGTKDPNKLPLDYRWDFGDGQRALGAYATHRFDAPGEYAVKLSVANLAGLVDEDTVVVRVAPRDAAPLAALRVVDGAGVASTRGLAGDAFTFEALASDPEGAPLAFEWDLGDGATSHDAVAKHAYAKPGVYTVRLAVTDRAGNGAAARETVFVDGAWHAEGAFEPMGATQADTAIFVAREARAVAIALAFDAGAGLSDLEVVVLDAAGKEVARSTGEGAPGAQGDAARALRIDRFEGAGEWTVRVLKERGLSVAWTLDITESV